MFPIVFKKIVDSFVIMLLAPNTRVGVASERLVASCATESPKLILFVKSILFVVPLVVRQLLKEEFWT